MDPIDPTAVTFPILLTAAGTGIAAGIVTGLVQLLKTAFPALDARFSGASMAFVLSAALYIVAGFAVGVSTLDAALVVFLAWLTCGAAAVGVYSTIKSRVA